MTTTISRNRRAGDADRGLESRTCHRRRHAATIKQAAGRQIRCARLSEAAALLPSVRRALDAGGYATLMAADSDRALRALLATDESASDIEIRSAGLEEAFLALTAADQASAVA